MAKKKKKKHPPSIPGPVTRSMAKKGIHEDVTSFIYLEKNNTQDYSQESSSQDNLPLYFNHISTSDEAKDAYNCFKASENMHLSEPMTVDKALNNPIWKKSMDQELKAQIDKNTWELVIPPKNVNIVGSKWVFHSKRDDKNIIIPKSCLVAQGFTQTFGFDYDETYMPVIRMTSLQTTVGQKTAPMFVHFGKIGIV